MMFANEAPLAVELVLFESPVIDKGLLPGESRSGHTLTSLSRHDKAVGVSERLSASWCFHHVQMAPSIDGEVINFSIHF